MNAQWRDITADAERLAGGKPGNSPIFVKLDSIKNIKSVNYKGVVYRRADFSYLLAGITQRERYVFECDDGSYRSEDTSPLRNWITPATSKDSMSWIAYKYLCPSSVDPWVKIAETTSGQIYYVNKENHWDFQHPYYGNVLTWLLSMVKSYGMRSDYMSSEEAYLYVSCARKILQIYAYNLQPEGRYVELKEFNPGSVGEEIISSVCQ